MTLDPATVAPAVDLIGQLIPSVASYTNTLTSILIDPSLPQVLQLTEQIYANYEGPSTTPANAPPAPVTAGVGLSSFVGPLDLIILIQENPWLPYVAVAAVLAVPFLIGLGVGERRGRKKARAAGSRPAPAQLP